MRHGFRPLTYTSLIVGPLVVLDIYTSFLYLKKKKKKTNEKKGVKNKV